MSYQNNIQAFVGEENKKGMAFKAMPLKYL